MVRGIPHLRTMSLRSASVTYLAFSVWVGKTSTHPEKVQIKDKRYLNPQLRVISMKSLPYPQIGISSVQFSHLVVSNSSRPHGPQHARPRCPLPAPGIYSNSSPLSQWCHPTISSSVVPFSSCLQSFTASRSFPMSQLIWHQVAKVLEFQLQHQSFQWTLRTDLLQIGQVGSPCSPRYSQESSPTPQFKTVNSLALAFLYSTTFTSILDYWKNHILDEMDFCIK